MSKFIVLLLVVALLYVLLRTKSGRGVRGGRPPGQDAQAEPFVACARCGVNVPRSEVVMGDGRSYCCEEHRRLG
jgi:uncharacterized protein